MKCIEIINSCELNRVDFLVDRIEESLIEIHRLAQQEDIRSYIFLVLMINYCKSNKKELVSKLSDFAAFISLNFFNYIEGMIQLSYFHQIEAIKNDPDNDDYKNTFLNFYCQHPDIEHDIEFEKKVVNKRQG